MFSPLTSSPERLTRSGAEDTKYSKYGFSNTGASSSSGALGSALASPYTTSLASYSLENFRCARGGIATPIVSPISAMGESKGDQNINKVEKSPTAQWYSQLRTDEALRALVKTYGVPTTERMDAYSGWLLSCERGDAISKVRLRVVTSGVSSYDTSKFAVQILSERCLTHARTVIIACVSCTKNYLP